MKNLVLFDLSCLMYVALYSRAGALSYNGQDTTVIYRTLSMMLSALKDFGPADYLIASDRSPYYRHQLYPAYKGHRTGAPDEIRRQEIVLRQFFQQSSSVLYGFQGLESDDIIASAAKQLAPLYDRVICYSSDQDLYQLITENVSACDPRTKKIVDLSQFKKTFGCEPGEWALVKAIVGDNSDNIQGIPGIGVKTAVKYIYQRASKTATETILENQELIEKNHQLTQLPYHGFTFTPMLQYSFSEHDLAEFFDTFGFTSFHSRLPSVLRLLNGASTRAVSPSAESQRLCAIL